MAAQMNDERHWRMKLNNLMQRVEGVYRLDYQCIQGVPEHTAPWTVLAYINQIEYGRGIARSQGEAKEKAAHQAFDQLYRELIQKGWIRQ